MNIYFFPQLYFRVLYVAIGALGYLGTQPPYSTCWRAPSVWPRSNFEKEAVKNGTEILCRPWARVRGSSLLRNFSVLWQALQGHLSQHQPQVWIWYSILAKSIYLFVLFGIFPLPVSRLKLILA